MYEKADKLVVKISLLESKSNNFSYQKFSRDIKILSVKVNVYFSEFDWVDC